MGLDSIEILVKVEQTFGISIPDREAEKIITVGDFHDAVWRHLEGKYSDKCKTQLLFYRLRISFFDSFRIARNDIRPDSSVNDIFPAERRREQYFEFAAANNIKLPALTLAKPWGSFLAYFGIAAIVGGLALSLILINFFDYTKWTLFIPVAGIILTVFVSGLLNPKRTVIKPSSLREFTEKLLSMNYAAIVKDDGINRKEVELVINHILVDMAGLEMEEVTPEKKIHHDLGID